VSISSTSLYWINLLISSIPDAQGGYQIRPIDNGLGASLQPPLLYISLIYALRFNLPVAVEFDPEKRTRHTISQLSTYLPRGNVPRGHRSSFSRIASILYRQSIGSQQIHRVLLSLPWECLPRKAVPRLETPLSISVHPLLLRQRHPLTHDLAVLHTLRAVRFSFLVAHITAARIEDECWCQRCECIEEKLRSTYVP